VRSAVLPHPLFWVKKKKITEEEKPAGQAKTKPGSCLPLCGGQILTKLEAKTTLTRSQGYAGCSSQLVLNELIIRNSDKRFFVPYE